MAIALACLAPLVAISSRSHAPPARGHPPDGVQRKGGTATPRSRVRTRRPPARLTLGWIGDVTPGSRYGLPAHGGRALFAGAVKQLREPDLMLANLEGTLSVGGVSKCGSDAVDCFAFQAPPANARALHDAGIDLVNLANNHSYDFGAPGYRQTLIALLRARVVSAGLPERFRVLRRRGMRIAVVGFATYPWAPSMNDPLATSELVRRAAAAADLVVVLFHAGAEGADRTRVPRGPEIAFGENRGNSRRFAHRAIHAGADLVLGSGPHVVRGMEVYRGRLIAYSLGNFAGVGNFATGGTLSLSGLLALRLDRAGRLRNGWWHSMSLAGSGIPRRDPSNASLDLVRRLSVADFADRPPRMLASGRILPPAP